MTNQQARPFAPSVSAGLSNEQRLAMLGGLSRGLSHNAILDSMRNAGLTIGRSRGLASLNELAGIRGNGVGIQKTLGSFTPSISVHTISPFVPAGQFRYWATYSAFNPNTGLPESRTAVVSFDDLVTRDEIDFAILDVLGNASEAYGFSLDPSGITYTTAEMGI